MALNSIITIVYDVIIIVYINFVYYNVSQKLDSAIDKYTI